MSQTSPSNSDGSRDELKSSDVSRTLEQSQGPALHQDVPESTVTNDNATLQFARINQRIDVFFANMEKRLAERFK
ncbi:MAG: hypothetical protein IJU76_06065, partial [Desulfovibrionaceae bacterium]|nr:hypothetical protein [Desulfovibrionaceae bacterium]